MPRWANAALRIVGLIAIAVVADDFVAVVAFVTVSTIAAPLHQFPLHAFAHILALWAEVVAVALAASVPVLPASIALKS